MGGFRKPCQDDIRLKQRWWWLDQIGIFVALWILLVIVAIDVIGTTTNRQMEDIVERTEWHDIGIHVQDTIVVSQFQNMKFGQLCSVKIVLE